MQVGEIVLLLENGLQTSLGASEAGCQKKNSEAPYFPSGKSRGRWNRLDCFNVLHFMFEGNESFTGSIDGI